MGTLSLYITDKIRMINDNLIKGLDSKNIESLESVKVPLDQLSNHVRESIQGNLRESVEILIKKLKKNDEITGTDLQIIEKWIVGDAKYYIEIENNFQDWVNECKRLNDLLKKYGSESFVEDETSLFRLNALLVDLRYTLADVIRYLNFSNRVKNFMDSASKGMADKEDKKILADLIERQLYSEEF